MGTRRKHRMLDEMEGAETISEEQFSVLTKLAKDRNADIRYRVAEQLSIADAVEAEALLLRLLCDRDDMVRVSASDSISACGSLEAIEPLKQLVVNDACFMARGYAAYSATDIALRVGAADAELTAFLKHALEEEPDDWVQAFLCAALYRLDQPEYLPRVLDALNNDSYQTRCAAVNLLCYTTKEKDIPVIREALVKRRAKEDPKTLSVISTIDECLEELDSRTK